MDRNSVQQRRDAIGKYSENVRKESIDDEPYLRGPPSVQAFPDSPPFSNAVVRICDREALTGGTLPTTSTYHCQLEPSPNNTPKILVELIERQKHLYSQRHLFYSDQNVEDWFREPKAVGENELYELNDFTKCMFHLWRVEPRLAAEFMNKINVLDQVPDADKLKIYKNFVVVRQVVEEPYTTWKHGGLENKWFVWTNRRYIDFNNPEKYFRNGAMKGLKLDLDTTQRLFIPSFLASMDNVGGLMKKFNLAEVEMVFLLGLSLFDPSVSNLTEDTRKQMKSLRDRLVLEMFDYIQEESTDFTPEVRLADLFSIVAEIKIHAIKCAENMQILRVFNLIPEDPCFEQMLNKS